MLNNMPVGQVNAHLPKDEFVMRVGVPHRSGSLAFHAFEKDYPVIVSAAAFWLNDKQRFHMPDVTSRNRCDVLEITATTGHEVAKSTASC